MYSPETIRLGAGEHEMRGPNNCILEWVSVINGLEFSDSPSCTDSLVQTFAVCINDAFQRIETRTKYLVPVIPLLSGHHVTPERAKQMDTFVLDWYYKTWIPFLSAKIWTQPLDEEVIVLLRELPSIVDKETETLAIQTVFSPFIREYELYNFRPILSMVTDIHESIRYRMSEGVCGLSNKKRSTMYRIVTDFLISLCHIARGEDPETGVLSLDDLLAGITFETELPETSPVVSRVLV